MARSYYTNTRILIKEGTKELGSISYSTGELLPEDNLSDEEAFELKIEADGFFKGELHKTPMGEVCLGRPDAVPTKGCYEARFRAPGNPDFNQYAPIAAQALVRGTTIEEMCESARAYITANDLGGGNWPEPPVYKYADKKGKLTRNKVGSISYNGKFWSVAERKAFELMMKEKYGKTETT